MNVFYRIFKVQLLYIYIYIYIYANSLLLSPLEGLHNPQGLLEMIWIQKFPSQWLIAILFCPYLEEEKMDSCFLWWALVQNEYKQYQLEFEFAIDHYTTFIYIYIYIYVYIYWFLIFWISMNVLVYYIFIYVFLLFIPFHKTIYIPLWTITQWAEGIQ